MSDLLQGTICGRIVELTSDPGMQNGQPVEVVLRPLIDSNCSQQSAAGMLAEDADLDASLQEIQRYRESALHRSSLQ